MIGWAFETLVASALLMGLVLLVRERVAAAFGARVAYLLWLLPFARMLLPRLPEAARPPVALPIDIDLSTIDAVPDAAPLAPPLPAAALPAPPPETLLHWTTGHWPLLLLGVWLGGAMVHFCWQVGLYRRFLRVALRGSALLCRSCGIAIHQGPKVKGPAAVGIVHRRILLPADFATRYDPAERRLVLAHEVAHHVRGDLIANAAALAVLSLHWFNPLAHRAYRAFRADQELACDATVLAHEAPELLPVYGAALVKSAHAATPAAACAIGTATMLKRRLTMMARPSRSRARRIGGGLLAAGTIVAGLGLTASGGMAAPSRLPGVQLAVNGMDGTTASLGHDFDGAARSDAPAGEAASASYRARAAAAPGLVRVAQVAGAQRLASSDDDRDMPLPPVPPLPAVAPIPPAAPVAPPAPPAAPGWADGADRGHGVAAEVRAEVREAMREAARERAEGERERRQALREASQARAEALREAERARAEASRERAEGLKEAARARAEASHTYAATAAHIPETVRAAMADARTQLAATCRNARPATGPESDGQAMARLSAGCVDPAAINAQVVAALRQARDGLRAADMGEDARERAVAAMDRAIARMEARGNE